MNSTLPRALRRTLDSQSVYDVIPSMNKILTIDSRLKLFDAVCSLHRYRRSVSCVYDSESTSFIASFDSRSVAALYLALSSTILNSKAAAAALTPRTTATAGQNSTAAAPSSHKPQCAAAAKAPKPNLWEATLLDWLDNQHVFPHVSLGDTLLKCLKLLVKHEVTRLFVWDPSRATVFSFVTKSSLISHIVATCTSPSPDWDLLAIRDFNIGVPGDAVVVVRGDMSINEAVQLLVSRAWNSCPVVNNLTDRRYIGMLSLTAFHRLINKCLMEPFQWSSASSVESILEIMQNQQFTHPVGRICSYDSGPVASSNVFINRLTPEQPVTAARDVPVLVRPNENRDPSHELANYVSTSPAVQSSDMSLRQIFAHLALAEDKRIIILDPAHRIRRLICPSHIANFILKRP